MKFCDYDGMRYDLGVRVTFKTGKFYNRIDGNWNIMTSLNKENSYRVSTKPGVEIFKVPALFLGPCLSATRGSV